MLTRRIKVHQTAIYILNGLFAPALERSHVFRLSEPQPVIRVFEGKTLRREYRLESSAHNPDLTGQYWHTNIRVSPTGAVQIEGILARNSHQYPSWQDPGYEALRLQPFFLSAHEHENTHLRGAGLIQRGLHDARQCTPAGVRCVCVCDVCQQSFTLQHVHAGASNGQYFYSNDSQQTLFVHQSHLRPLLSPAQLHKEPALVVQLEQHLPKPTLGAGSHRYYNSLRCPHCQANFVDFNHNPLRRAQEPYGCYFLNQSLQHLN